MLLIKDKTEYRQSRGKPVVACPSLPAVSVRGLEKQSRAYVDVRSNKTTPGNGGETEAGTGYGGTGAMAGRGILRRTYRNRHGNYRHGTPVTSATIIISFY